MRGMPLDQMESCMSLADRFFTCLDKLFSHLAVTRETLETRAAMGLDLGYRRTP